MISSMFSEDLLVNIQEAEQWLKFEVMKLLWIAILLK